MASVKAVTAAGGEVSIEDADLQSLASRMHGHLLRAGNDGYDAARAVWNGMIDHRPALIARSAGTADVVEAVRFGREHELLTSVRCGGHNVAGKSIAHEGLMLDLSLMQGVEVDVAARTARVQGGALLGDLDRATQPHGLATTAGVADDTGVGGLTLGGGVGFLARKHGLACDNLISAEVVTAAGEVVRASEDENADLLWGLRGGGGNFGVVTEFVFRLHAVGPSVLGGGIVYPIDGAAETLRFYREYAPEAPGELATLAALTTSPDGAPCFAVSVCATGSAGEAERSLEPLRRFGKPLVDEISSTTYLDVQGAGSQTYPKGDLFYWKSSFLGTIRDELIEWDIEHFMKRPTAGCSLAWQQFGGAIGDVGPSDTAFWHRDVQWDHFSVGTWKDPAQTEMHLEWARAWWEPAQPYTLGGEYVNNLGEEGEDRVRAAYGGNYERLAALKNKYDPTNFFTLNANIRPR
jgi:FAD/FMN-containing dehydrogenase